MFYRPAVDVEILRSCASRAYRNRRRTWRGVTSRRKLSTPDTQVSGLTCHLRAPRIISSIALLILAFTYSHQLEAGA